MGTLAPLAAPRGTVTTQKSNDRTMVVDRDDDNTPFRFLDLLPELRNSVYENLLRFEGTCRTCHPHILRTCKKVQREASSVLYGGNKITINIYQDRVEAHGVRCGVYSPLAMYDPVSNPDDGSHRMSSIEWPDFVSRVWSLRVAAPYLTWYRDNPRWWPVSDRRRTAAINNVFYALCSQLRSRPRSGHWTRKLALECGIQWNCSAADLRMAFYPVRLLGVEKQYKASEGGRSRGVYYLHDSTAHHQAMMLRKGVLAPEVALMLRIDRIYIKMLELDPIPGWARVIHGRLHWILSLVDGIANRLGLLSDKKIERMLAHKIAWARDLTVAEFCDGQQELLDETNETILLEIELRADRNV